MAWRHVLGIQDTTPATEPFQLGSKAQAWLGTSRSDSNKALVIFANLLGDALLHILVLRCKVFLVFFMGLNTFVMGLVTCRLSIGREALLIATRLLRNALLHLFVVRCEVFLVFFMGLNTFVMGLVTCRLSIGREALLIATRLLRNALLHLFVVRCEVFLVFFM